MPIKHVFKFKYIKTKSYAQIAIAAFVAIATPISISIPGQVIP